MFTEYMSFETIEQQQILFGTADINVKIIEKELAVMINVRDSKIEIKGENHDHVKFAHKVLKSLLVLHLHGDDLKEDTIYRMIELSKEGMIDETLRAATDSVVLTYRGRPIKCKTLGQRNYVKALQENTVTLCIGPAGTGKTYLAVAQAAAELKEGVIDRIIMSRPAIEAGEERLGFLPGDLAQKVDPYLRPLYDALNDIFGTDKTQSLIDKGTIEIAPLAYMRGRTLNNARIIIDESQNASLSTLKMALTRLGEDSKMILTGDITQIDLPRSTDSGLEKCAAILNGIEGIAVMRLSNRDVVRHKLVREIVKAFEKAENAKPERRQGRHDK